jgi:hypothetical protein
MPMSVGTLSLMCLLWVAGQNPNEVIPLNQLKLTFPIQVKAEARSQISQFVLYVSSDRGRTWQQSAAVPSDKNEFIFYAPQDGEYWLRVATINRQGKQEPENVYAERSPPQKVLIDTQRPIIRLTSVERKGDAVEVAWNIQEDHPDLTSLRLEYRTPDTPAGTWEQAAITPSLVGQGRIRPASPKAMEVRVQMKDIAGNSSVAEGRVAATNDVTVAGFTQERPTLPSAPRSTDVPPAPPGPKEVVPPAPILPPTAPEPARPPAAASVASTAPSLPPTTRKADTTPFAVPPTPAASTEVPVVSQARQLPPVQFVNSTELTLEYQLDRVGPSGVGKVVLYMTEDDGQTWHDFADDPLAASTVRGGRYQRRIELPSEGLFGFRLVVLSKVGLGEPPPKPGDPPEMRVEVDLTAPKAKLYCQPDPQHENALLLHWEATDKNLTAAPVSLEWAKGPEGPWREIKSGLPADGSYSWKVTPDIPVWVYLRLRVRDAAGNEAVAVTADRQLTDLTRPVGHLCGVSVTPLQ